MTCFKEILAGIKSCFSLTANERLIIMLVLTLFLFGLALRWRHLSHERTDPDLNESRDEPPARNASHSDAGGPVQEMNALRK